MSTRADVISRARKKKIPPMRRCVLSSAGGSPLFQPPASSPKKKEKERERRGQREKKIKHRIQSWAAVAAWFDSRRFAGTAGIKKASVKTKSTHPGWRAGIGGYRAWPRVNTYACAQYIVPRDSLAWKSINAKLGRKVKSPTDGRVA